MLSDIDSGMICETCSFAIHNRCMAYSFIPCLKDPNQNGKIDGEQKLFQGTIQKHCLKHVFISSSYHNENLSFCGHCGLKKNVESGALLKCGECRLSAHKSCALEMPDLCGLKYHEE